jgi:hypothetical protein
MNRNGRYPKVRFLCLTLLLVLSAMSGCQAPATPQPTATPRPEPTASPLPEPTASPLPEPTAFPSPEPTQVPVAAEPTPTELRTFPRVTVAEVQQWMAAGEPLFFVDARSDEAWSTATTKVPGALRVPPHDVEPHLAEIPQDRRVVIYCT